jgi:hypothetical protein
MLPDVLDIEHVLLSDVIDLGFLIEFSTDADDRKSQPLPILTPVSIHSKTMPRS